MTEEVQTQKKDKQKVLNEVFTEDMLKGFLIEPSPSPDQSDFRRLLFAFRGLPVDAFIDFLTLFQAAGHCLTATDEQGRTFAQHLKRMPRQHEYLKALLAEQASSTGDEIIVAPVDSAAAATSPTAGQQ